MKTKYTEQEVEQIRAAWVNYVKLTGQKLSYNEYLRKRELYNEMNASNYIDKSGLIL